MALGCTAHAHQTQGHVHSEDISSAEQVSSTQSIMATLQIAYTTSNLSVTVA